MSVVAAYNMKGGVGKTTTAVNLSYRAAADGHRVLLWDLDPQAASSFAFRVRPRGEGFRKKWIHGGEAFLAGIRETDYANLDLLPADFTHRKLDRLLGTISKPAHAVAGLIETVRREYDVVILDCPAGFSLLTEGIFAAADLIVVPTIPAVLSLRMVTTLIDWAIRTESPSELVPFLSMVDRRKPLHRQICEWSAGQSGTFLKEYVPYASVVEQMTVRRAPLATYAPRDVATTAFAAIWAEVDTRLWARCSRGVHQTGDRRRFIRHAIESLIARLESGDAAVSAPPPVTTVAVTHRFDTGRGDLRSRGCLLELREEAGSFLLVAAAPDLVRDDDTAARAEARIDATWAKSILAGAMSPLEALERRLGPHPSPLCRQLRAASGERTLQRVESRAAGAGVPAVPSSPAGGFEAAPDLRAVAGTR